MIPTTIIIGLLLNLVGLVGFFATGAIHYTALIPCILGAILVLCGIIALNPKLHMHVMHVAVLVGLLGFGATVSAFAKLPNVLKFAGAENENAAIAKIATALLCGLFVILCVRSFVVARLLKKQGKKGY